MKTPLFSSRHNHRYPYELTFADAGKGASVQPYKCRGARSRNDTESS